MNGKRIWALLLVLCLAAAAASGCAPRADRDSLADLALVTAPPAEPTPVPEPYAGTKLTEGLYRLDYMEDGYVWDVALWRSRVAVLYTDYDEVRDLNTGRIVFYDAVTGAELSRWDLQGQVHAPELVHYADGALGVTEDRSLHLFRDPLTAPEYRHTETSEEIPSQITPKGDCRIEEGQLLYTPADGSGERKLYDVLRDADIEYADDEHICLRLYADAETDASTVVVSPETEEVREYAIDATDVKAVSGELWQRAFYSGRVRELEGDREILLEEGLDGEYLTALEGGLAATTKTVWDGDDHSTVFRLYRAGDGALLFRSGGDWPLAGSWIETADMDAEDGLVLIFGQEPGEGDAERYCFLMPTEGLVPLEKHSDPALDTETFRKGIEDRFGVRVFTGAEAVSDYAPTEYELSPFPSDDVVPLALKRLSETLEKFPEGFFRELTEPVDEYGYSELHILLAGRIRAVGTAAPTSVAGFTQKDPDRPVEYIALDARFAGRIESDAAHEIFHASEDRISTMIGPEFDGFGRWTELNPEGVDYYYGYVDGEGNDYSDGALTAGSGENDACFIDSYSRTFPNEDRARVFEYLFVVGSDETAYEGGRIYPFRSDVLYAKAEYLCGVMRRAFKTVAATDCAHWERMFRGKAG